MAQHVSSVCVITTQVGNNRFGLTATAVSSVCAEPPRILVCINKKGLTHQMIQESGYFCVNLLAENQDDIAKKFAGIEKTYADRFEIGNWTTLVTGSPVLEGSAAVFDCQSMETSDQFTHTVFFGEVQAANFTLGQDTLLYGSRRFQQLRKFFLALESDGPEYL